MHTSLLPLVFVITLTHLQTSLSNPMSHFHEDEQTYGRKYDIYAPNAGQYMQTPYNGYYGAPAMGSTTYQPGGYQYASNAPPTENNNRTSQPYSGGGWVVPPSQNINRANQQYSGGGWTTPPQLPKKQFSHEHMETEREDSRYPPHQLDGKNSYHSPAEREKNEVRHENFLSNTSKPEPKSNYEIICKVNDQFVHLQKDGDKYSKIFVNSKRCGKTGQFEFEPVNGNAYVIKCAKDPKMVFDIDGASKKDGARLIGWWKHSQDNQKFILSPSNEEGYFEIKGVKSGKCLELDKNNQLVQSKCDKQDNQKFALTLVPNLSDDDDDDDGDKAEIESHS